MNAIDTQLRDPIDSGHSRWRMAVLKDSIYYSCRYELAFDDICNYRQLCALVCVCF